MKDRALTVLLLMGLLVVTERTLNLPVPKSGGMFAKSLWSLGKKHDRKAVAWQELTMDKSTINELNIGKEQCHESRS